MATSKFWNYWHICHVKICIVNLFSFN